MIISAFYVLCVLFLVESNFHYGKKLISIRGRYFFYIKAIHKQCAVRETLNMNSFALKSCSLEQFEVCLATSIYIQRGNLPPGSQRTFGTIFRSHDVEKHNLHNWQKTRIHVVQLFQVTTVEESKMKFRQSVAALGKQVVLNDSALLGSCCLIAPLCDTASIEVRRSWRPVL